MSLEFSKTTDAVLFVSVLVKLGRMEMITGIVKHKKVIKRGMSVIGLTSGETLLLTLLKELFKCQSED